MSTLNVANITDGTTTVGTSYVVNGSAKAWVNFNGTGTVAIRDSLNLSSLTDNGTGDYTVGYPASFATADYAVSGLASRAGPGDPAPCNGLYGSAPTVSAVRLQGGNTANLFNDSLYYGVSIHGELA